MSTIKAANVQNTGSGAPTFKNSSGTEIGTLCRAWVNFKGTDTVSIRDDFNVSSITDNGTGDFTVTFDNAMPSVNYAVVLGYEPTTTSSTNTIRVENGSQTTTSFQVETGSFQSSAGNVDRDYDANHAAVFI
jgi:hypothetical protein|tara:strand:+ start:8797 stop:9192 length:396 start_codon:yes stop_codon:yes gene_type:complete